MNVEGFTDLFSKKKAEDLIFSIKERGADHIDVSRVLMEIAMEAKRYGMAEVVERIKSQYCSDLDALVPEEYS
jgi:hypothetical protein